MAKTWFKITWGMIFIALVYYFIATYIDNKGEREKTDAQSNLLEHTPPRLNSKVVLSTINEEFIWRKDRRQIIILIFYKPFGSTKAHVTSKDVCGEWSTCHVTYDRTYFDIADAVVFHFAETKDASYIPKRSFKNQLFVWWCREAKIHNNLYAFDNVFNLTFTYRRDSDIYGPYGGVHQLLHDIKRLNKTENIDKLMSSKLKDKEAIWFVSNCKHKKRLELANALVKEGIKVQRYGFCYTGTKQFGGKNSTEMADYIHRFKFYLSFENSFHCKDYITEKFWNNALLNGAVPIVYGAPKNDIEVVAPKNSFVHVDDFTSTGDLAKYIKYLLSNETAYLEYIKWREWIHNPDLIEQRFKKVPQYKKQDGFCDLCKILKSEKDKEKLGITRKTFTVPSLASFWFEQENSDCVS